jgi:hypothetical protein
MSVPVIGRVSVSFGIILCRLPDVPITIGVVLGLSRLPEPLMLITGMIHDQVENELHASLMELVLEDINI